MAPAKVLNSENSQKNTLALICALELNIYF